MNLAFTSASRFSLCLSWSPAAACAAVPANEELVARTFPLLRLPSQERLRQDLEGRRSRDILLSPFPMQDALQTRKKNSSPIRREFGQDKYQLLPKAMPGAGCAEVARCARWVSRTAVTAPRFPAPAQVPSRQESLPASDVPSRFPSSVPPRSQFILPKPCQVSRNGLYQGPRTRQLAFRVPAEGAGCARDAIYFLVIAVRS